MSNLANKDKHNIQSFPNVIWISTNMKHIQVCYMHLHAEPVYYTSKSSTPDPLLSLPFCMFPHALSQVNHAELY